MNSIFVTKLGLLGVLTSVIQLTNANYYVDCISINPSRDYPCIPYEDIRENGYVYGHHISPTNYNFNNESESEAEGDRPQYRTIIPENIETMDTRYVEYVPERYPWSPISNSDQDSHLHQDLDHYRYENVDEPSEPIDPKYSYEIQSPPPPTTYIIPAETPVAKGYPEDEGFYYNYKGSPPPPVESEPFTIQIKKPIMHRRHFRPQRPIAPTPFAFPNSPFPGWSGIYSPNPGYLVKQRFQVYKRPAYMPFAKKSLWQKALG